MDINSFYAREFHWRDYNCWHFAREVWKELTGTDLADFTPDVINTAEIRASFDAHVPELTASKTITQIPHPVDPCLVLMLRPRVLNHVGIYTRGGVLHLIPRQHVVHQDLQTAILGFEEVRFYK